MNGKPTIKKLKFPPDIMDVLRRTTWSADGKTAELPDMLTDSTVKRMKQVFAALGGTWDAKAGEFGIGAYRFSDDPRERVQGFTANGNGDAGVKTANGDALDWVVDMLIANSEGMPGGLKGKILVPGAGQNVGMVRKIVEHCQKHKRRYEITVIENSKPRADLLRAFFKGNKHVTVIEDNFLDNDWASDYRFVITIAPASDYIQHIMHAWTCLDKGGSFAGVGFLDSLPDRKADGMFKYFLDRNGIVLILIPAEKMRASGIDAAGIFLSGVK